LNSKIDIEEIKRRLDNNDKNVELLFSYLDELIDKQDNKVERTKIGYKK
jgi:tetrahydromethanopterin S-methyltransferase subunit G